MTGLRRFLPVQKIGVCADAVAPNPVRRRRRRDFDVYLLQVSGLWGVEVFITEEVDAYRRGRGEDELSIGSDCGHFRVKILLGTSAAMAWMFGVTTGEHA